MHEDSYGRVKRLSFVAAAVTPDTRAILDVGCGTGSQLTRPLAESFPHARVLGIDADPDSLNAARSAGGLRSLAYVAPEALAPDARFDLVIASEVIEHIDDPLSFLLWLRERLAPEGRIVLTVPNGYGPFELAAFAEALATAAGIWPLLRRLKRRLTGTDNDDTAGGRDSLAVSPHVNFFTRGALLSLFAASGLAVCRFSPRTFLCGFLFDQLVASLRLAAWNARIADRLPAALASDWMFELAVAGSPRPRPWRRSVLARARRALNRHRWKPAA